MKKLLIPLLILFIVSDALPAQQGKRFWMSPASVRADFWKMFAKPGEWAQIRARTNVFSIHVNAFQARDTANMTAAAALFNAENIPVNVECGGLRPFSGCDSLAGERQAMLELLLLQKWMSFGGRVDIITMDSPINTMIAGGDPNGTCDWSVYRAAYEMADYMKEVRNVLPGVTFALVEPVPWYRVGSYPAHPGNDYGDLLKTLDTVLVVLALRGESIQVFHSDSPWEYSSNTQTQGWKKIKAVEEYLHAHGIRHGRIANSQEGGSQSDSLFYARTLQSFKDYKAVGGDPDELEVWCWYPYPKANTPEDSAYTFTNTCKQFVQLAFSPPVPATAEPLEPLEGRIYHGVGQTADGVDEYIAALNDSAIHPIVHKIYFDIPGVRGMKFAQLRDALNVYKNKGIIPELSIAFTDGTIWTDSLIATSTAFDAAIDTLAMTVAEVGGPMFVRPGFEFNGWWNPYRPYLYPVAFRKIVDAFRQRIGQPLADSLFAFVWCYYPGGGAPNDFDSVDVNGPRWYPGDEYVNWFGLDEFYASDFHPDSADYKRGQITTKGKGERFLAMAQAKNKPVFLSETSAVGVNVSADTMDGYQDWENWFEPFFRFIEVHPQIKGWNYINLDWTHYGQYQSWGDSRIGNSAIVTANYRQEMKKPTYIHLPFLPLPDKVLLKVPAMHSAFLWGDYITIAWQTSQPNVISYHFEAALDSAFTEIRHEYLALTDTVGAILPAVSTVYYWRVRAQNASGYGPWSDVWQFRINSVTSAEGVAGFSPAPITLYQNTPNPVSSSASIRLDVHKPTVLSVTLYNSLGKEVRTIAKGDYTPGAYTLTINASDLPRGVYLYRATASGYSAGRTMVIR